METDEQEMLAIIDNTIQKLNKHCMFYTAKELSFLIKYVQLSGRLLNSESLEKTKKY